MKQSEIRNYREDMLEDKRLRSWEVKKSQPLNFSVSQLLVSVLTAYCLLLFTGCQQDTPPPPSAQQAKKEAPKPAPPAAVETKEEKKQEAASDIKQKNPFKPFITKTALKEKTVVPTTPLQKYELEQFKLVAVVWGINGSVAMLETPDGKGYSVKRGDLIGRRGGRVKRIEKNAVVVEERFAETTGESMTSEFTIKLPLPKEEEEML